MVRILLASVVTIAALLTSSCAKDIQNTDAVKQSVMDYLRSKNTQTGLNMDAMTVDVTSVSYEKDTARATLRFTPKGMPGGGMNMTYVLDRKGNKWVVRGKQESGNPHGAGGMAPQGEMPPGHPATGGAPGAQPLPPGHPAVGSKQ